MYKTLTTMRYSHQKGSEYIHIFTKRLAETLGELGIDAKYCNFSKEQNLKTESVRDSYEMPEWMGEMANISSSNCRVTWNNYHSSSGVPFSTSAISSCRGVCYWEVMGVKYALFLGGSSNIDSNSSSGISLNFVQNLDDGESENTESINMKTCIIFQGYYTSNYYDNSYFGKMNVCEQTTISLNDTGFHIFIRYGSTNNKNTYLGFNKTEYNDKAKASLISNSTNIYPTYSETLPQTITIQSPAPILGRFANSILGDMINNNFNSFDVYYGLSLMTLLGRLKGVVAVPHVRNITYGDFVDFNGDLYMYVEDCYSYSTSYDRTPIFVKVD